ncbi:alpha-1,2-fucosyltransferase [Vibrio navarrensis]|uniref:alpha-1,2-fucosyltransferase n=1 Tax=Vibrio navarrensis TaxID=29495 RepID=UPI00051E12EE|nr:alpha-1,2-fucosyltransferase [Vibrio navarrensis]KGK17398.1 glycosyl transferase family 11 [Vibrio navarrensis]
MKIVKVVGGLGSQMFAYALYLSLKEKYDKNEKIILNTSFYEKFKQHNGFELNDIFGISENNNELADSIIEKRTFIHKLIYKLIFKEISAESKKYNFNEEVFNKGNIIYNQCWTSWKYFDGYESLIKETFKFRELVEKENIEVAKIIESSNSVSIHVRRGDYLDSPGLKGLSPLWYYRESINYMNKKVENPSYFVFSDDISWCKENLGLESAHYIDWNKKTKSFRDMQLMSMCKHNIIPNSSFSWWGAYLNKNREKIVITPERWGNLGLGLELKDINHPEWVVLKNYID